MPRKPSSVFVITQPQGNTGPTQAYREPLTDIEDVDRIVARHYLQHPVGTQIFVVDDTKVDAYTINLTLEPIDDPRLNTTNGGGA
jgi:hypothetical protein